MPGTNKSYNPNNLKGYTKGGFTLSTEDQMELMRLNNYQGQLKG